MTSYPQLGILVLVLALVPALQACRDSTATAGPLAEDQSNARADLELVRAVRQRLVADATLSMRAKNAVVVAEEGRITVRGEVADRVEHELLVAKVASVPGVVEIDDRLSFEAKVRERE